MGRTQSLQFWFIFGPNLPPENQKYCKKQKFLQKNSFFGLWNDLIRRSQINHRILVKFIKNPKFWSTNWPKLPPRQGQRVRRNSHIAYLRNHLSIVSSSVGFSFWVFATLDFTFRTPLLFLFRDPIWLFLGRFLGNDSNDNDGIKLKLWPNVFLMGLQLIQNGF